MVVKQGIPSNDPKNDDTQNAKQDWEKRFLDTQADYTRKCQENARLKAELEAYKNGDNSLSLSEEQKQRLEELKYSDPDAWRKELNNLEKQKRDSLEKDIQTKANELTEIEQRRIILDDFVKANPQVLLNDEVIALDIPPRITRKLEEGKISFSEFLVECKDYLSAKKVVKDVNTTLEQPNLTKVGGDNKLNVKKDSIDYSKVII